MGESTFIPPLEEDSDDDDENEGPKLRIFRTVCSSEGDDKT